ncbi:hypothetical protein ACFLQN_02915 [Candidatus Aenigmatarchaeota archaeon]
MGDGEKVGSTSDDPDGRVFGFREPRFGVVYETMILTNIGIVRFLTEYCNGTTEIRTYLK